MRNIIPGCMYVWQPGILDRCSTSKGEDNIDRRFYCDWLAVQHEWAVSHSLDGFCRHALQHWWSADHSKLFDGPVLRDDGLYYNCSLNACSLCYRWIGWLDGREQLSGCDTGGYVQRSSW